MTQYQEPNYEEHNWQPRPLWDCLEDKDGGEYKWKKENRSFANCYVCYFKDREIGLIPIQRSPSDVEWANWLDAAYKRYPDGLTLNILMQEIEERHKKRLIND